MCFHGRLSRSTTAGLCGTSQRWVVGAVCGLGILLVTAPKPVQAIDCRKASTNVEHAICRDTEVDALDRELTQALHRVLETHPNERDSMLTDERHWIATRDASCSPLGDDVSKMHDCLEEAYREQLDMVRRRDSALPAGSSTGSRVAACKGLLDRYRPLANTHSGKRPLAVLAQAGAAGFELTGRGDTILHPASDLVSWAKGQQPPVSISAQLSESFASDGNGGMLQKAPGVPFFMLSRLEGSAACDSSVFFFVKDGIALPSRRPFDDAEDNCPNGGVFASLDSVPLYVRENYDYQPGMQASLEVATWQSDHFEAACTVSLSYLPRVSAKTLNTSDDGCDGADCEDMRKAAFELAKAKAAGTVSAESLLRGLTAQQRERYQAEKSAAEGQSDASASEHVVFVPFVRQGEVYVARIADRTIGWRDYADQSVKFERLEDGKIIEKAAFAVGVWKGELENAGVESTR
ncbi:MAG: hypothetical protein JWL65_2646 [Gammaproteobacteria bacterium]|nr:hypothetical protein [Gammaproteobacteria bacterium]